MLRAVRQGAFADRAFERVAGSLGDADRRLAHELAYGVLRLRGRLDHVLDRLARGGAGRLEPDVLDILRLGAYQLLELDRVPAYAAVSDAVEAAKRERGRGAASLVNAVLRKLSGSPWQAFAFPSPERDIAGYLATWGSHPRWLVERWLARWPPGEVERLVEYDNARPALHVTAVAEPAEVMRRLEAAGVVAQPVSEVPASLGIDGGDLATALAAAPLVVQDPAAAAVVDYMALERACRVVDLCAAPGGKGLALAARGHEVVAVDVSRPRLLRLLENRTRLAERRLHVVLADARRPPIAAAPAVLLDAPCTGTGTLARHPDGRWRLRADNLVALVRLQGALLEAAAAIVEPGGLLVYATCSLEPEENEAQVKAFLDRHPEFESRPPVGAVASELLGNDGALSVLPQRHGMDGAYAARLRRRNR